MYNVVIAKTDSDTELEFYRASTKDDVIKLVTNLVGKNEISEYFHRKKNGRNSSIDFGVMVLFNGYCVHTNNCMPVYENYTEDDNCVVDIDNYLENHSVDFYELESSVRKRITPHLSHLLEMSANEVKFKNDFIENKKKMHEIKTDAEILRKLTEKYGDDLKGLINGNA